jgi:phage-related tail protein
LAFPPFGFYFRGFKPFPSRKEYLDMLEEYRKDLEEELKELEKKIEETKRSL